MQSFSKCPGIKKYFYYTELIQTISHGDKTLLDIWIWTRNFPAFLLKCTKYPTPLIVTRHYIAYLFRDNYQTRPKNMPRLPSGPHIKNFPSKHIALTSTSHSVSVLPNPFIISKILFSCSITDSRLYPRSSSHHRYYTALRMRTAQNPAPLIVSGNILNLLLKASP
jgi:hypothetical protein